MLARARHQRKEIEVVLADAEAHGWRIETKTKGYWKAYCTCGLHQKTVKSTPSDPNYSRNLLGWFRRTCGWPKENS